MLFVIQLTLAKKDTFGTIIKCISKSRYVRIIESQIMGVRTNAGTNSRCIELIELSFKRESTACSLLNIFCFVSQSSSVNHC